ncbi:MAG: hypothetical protein R3D80_12135 [Paracoccaceae bacterium]
MKAGIVTLIAGYVFSQFYRAFLPVLAPALEVDLGATPEGLGRASGLWFLAFAAMRSVGWALDHIEGRAPARRRAAWRGRCRLPRSLPWRRPPSMCSGPWCSWASAVRRC